MKCKNIILIKRVGKNGTNTEGLKKKPEFKGTYSIASSLMYRKIKLLYLGRFIYRGGDRMVEK